MEKTNGSRLLQMKARFQQKQMQEREMKIASLYEAQQARALGRVRLSPSNGVSEATTPPEPPIPRQPGKVRQMFEERRTKAGIDKSYPLQPIHNTERTAARKVLPNGYSKVTSNSRTSVEKKTSKTSVSSTIVSVKKTQKTDLVNGSGDLNHNHEPDMNSSKHELSQSNGNFVLDTEEFDRVDNNYLIENETFPDSLAPATPRSPVPEPEPKKPPRKSPVVKSSSPAKLKLQPAPVAPPRRVTSEKTVPESNKSRAGVMQRAANPVPKKNTVTAPSTPRKATASVGGSSSKTAVGGEGDACAVCGRRFAPDRIEKHQSICRKTQAKKRKPFDVLKHRLAGTEAEPFISKLRKSGPGAASATKANKPLNNNWRQKHNDFIQAIRAAKQVQAHLNAGGKLSDLPPPPPSENPDYVQCPHCNRRFNQGAAERHIPKCANFQFNKPKPNAKRR